MSAFWRGACPVCGSLGPVNGNGIRRAHHYGQYPNPRPGCPSGRVAEAWPAPQVVPELPRLNAEQAWQAFVTAVPTGLV